MARRASSRRSGRASAAPTGNTNFDLLGLVGADRETFAFIEGIDNLDKGIADIQSEAARRTTIDSLDEVIQRGTRIGATWQLLNIRAGRPDSLWTVNVGEDHVIKRENMVSIEVPVGTLPGQLPPPTVRGTPTSRVRMEQADLVVWDKAGRNGTLLFMHLRANQRAMLVDFSVQHLGTCARVFTNRRIAREAVQWTQRAIADKILSGNLRRAEGLEYVSSCIRVFNAYTNAKRGRNATEADGIEAAQTALTPRGGVRAGASPTQMMQRMIALTAHLLSTVAKAGLETPFTRMFPNPRALGFFVDGLWTAEDQAVWDEYDSYEGATTQTAFGQLAFPSAADHYLFTYADDGAKQPVPEAANTVSGGRESFVWYQAGRRQEGEGREYITDQSEPRFESAGRAMQAGTMRHRSADGSRARPRTAASVDFIRTVEVMVGSVARFRWERVQVLSVEPVVTFPDRAAADAARIAAQYVDQNLQVAPIERGGRVIYGLFSTSRRTAAA